MSRLDWWEPADPAATAGHRTTEEVLDPARIQQQVSAVLKTFVDAKTADAQQAGLPVDVPCAVGNFLAAGGKRMRPLLCVLGWHMAGGPAGAALPVRVGAALEMFHAFCLIHDDVMDQSETRRGRATVHRALAARHRTGRSAKTAEQLGIGGAILAGDLAMQWSDELLHGHGQALAGYGGDLDAEQRKRVLPLVNLMRAEVMHGQFLDLRSTGCPTADVSRALAIVRYKTAKYTIERPLHIGAALAGAQSRLLERISAFALPLGEAFQLRDDLLGVFGDPERTGKPTMDDLRAGKHTVLIALALQGSDAAQTRMLRRLYGSPHLNESGAAVLRTLLKTTGAERAVERLIADLHHDALTALDTVSMPPAAREHLRELAHRAAWRTA